MEEIFERLRADRKKLLAYGFAEGAEGLAFSRRLSMGMELQVTVGADGSVAHRVLDEGELYTLHEVETAVGAFVGQVRLEVEAALREIAARCFAPEPFKQPIAKQLLAEAGNRYGEEPEFLWEDENCILRRKDNRKWYAAFLIVSGAKLGLNDAAPMEIVNLKAEPGEMARLLRSRGFFPGWHMNKKHWYSVLLDGTVPADTVFALMEQSRRLVAKGKGKNGITHR